MKSPSITISLPNLLSPGTGLKPSQTHRIGFIRILCVLAGMVVLAVIACSTMASIYLDRGLDLVATPDGDGLFEGEVMEKVEVVGLKVGHDEDDGGGGLKADKDSDDGSFKGHAGSDGLDDANDDVDAVGRLRKVSEQQLTERPKNGSANSIHFNDLDDADSLRRPVDSSHSGKHENADVYQSKNGSVTKVKEKDHAKKPKNGPTPTHPIDTNGQRSQNNQSTTAVIRKKKKHGRRPKKNKSKANTHSIEVEDRRPPTNDSAVNTHQGHPPLESDSTSISHHSDVDYHPSPKIESMETPDPKGVESHRPSNNKSTTDNHRIEDDEHRSTTTASNSTSDDVGDRPQKGESAAETHHNNLDNDNPPNNDSTASTHHIEDISQTNVSLPAQSSSKTDLDLPDTKILSERYFRAHGFRFCRSLENAKFDSLSIVFGWNMKSIAEKNPTMKEFVREVDKKAAELFAMIKQLHRDFHDHDVKSFSCYAAADGANEIADFSEPRMLYTVDPAKFMQPNVPHVVPTYFHGRERRTYKVAYLILAEGDQSVIENIKHQLERLDDGSSLFLIHVESRCDDLYKFILPHIHPDNIIPSEAQNITLHHDTNATRHQGFSKNVFLAEKRYPNIGSTAFVIWMQLNGYFTLMDLGDWGHVVLLSAFDVPVWGGMEVGRKLEGNEIYMQHWYPNERTTWRVLRQHILGDYGHSHLYESGLMYPPFYSMRACEHSTMTILPRDVIHYLRTDEKSATTLAFAEHYWKPDGLFFCNVILSNPDFVNRVINHNKYIWKREGRDIYLRKSAIRKDDDDPPPFWGGEKKNVMIEFLFVGGVDVRSDEGKKIVEGFKELEKEKEEQ
ncbi:hypothetical protein HDU67_006773 [Dinochytrium kinnereticum]|nr:hypothetical protein HDU67_006773 [Dinochytrium kinnereticum]